MDESSQAFDSIPEHVEVAVVGAGFAGLVAARRLARAGREVHLFDPSPDPGGRVRTQSIDGFRLDLGFQVLLTGFPAIREELDLEALALRTFEPGAVIVRDGKQHSLPDPFRTPHRWLEALRYPLATLTDKVRTRSLRNRLRSESIESIFAAPARMAADELREMGFSERFVSTFWLPFFSAVFLDPPLEVSTRMFHFVFRCLAIGDIALPRGGIGEAPRQIAEGIPAGRYHPGTRALKLLLEEGTVRGLSVGAAGDPKAPAREVKADAIILATGPEEARRLSGLDLPLLEPLGVSVVYFALDRPVTSERRIFLNGGGSGPGHHVVFLSNIASEYAPAGTQLVSVTILGTPEAGGDILAVRVRRQMAVWFPEADTGRWRWLATYKIPFAQFRQPPGILDHLPGARTQVSGLYLAGDYTRNSSVQGAMESGKIAAETVLGGI